jgi:GMP synthase-like glutamine amidotransferase
MSNTSKNAMYQLGDNILTFQGHPEFTKPYCQALMEKTEGNFRAGNFWEGNSFIVG